MVCDYNRRYLEQHYPDIYPALAKKIHLHHLGLDLAEFGYQPDGRPRTRFWVWADWKRVNVSMCWFERWAFFRREVLRSNWS